MPRRSDRQSAARQPGAWQRHTANSTAISGAAPAYGRNAEFSVHRSLSPAAILVLGRRGQRGLGAGLSDLGLGGRAGGSSAGQVPGADPSLGPRPGRGANRRPRRFVQRGDVRAAGRRAALHQSDFLEPRDARYGPRARRQVPGADAQIRQRGPRGPGSRRQHSGPRGSGRPDRRRAGHRREGADARQLPAQSLRLCWELVPAVEIRVDQVGVRTLKVGKDPAALPPDASGRAPTWCRPVIAAFKSRRCRRGRITSIPTPN